MVDEDWKPMAAKEIPILTEYVKMMISLKISNRVYNDVVSKT